MDVKCRYCGVKKPKQEMYCVVKDGKNQYFCDTEHYKLYIKEQEKAEKLKADKEKVYDLVCDIFGYRIQNSALWKEKNDWNQLKSDEVIAVYLTEKKDYLTGAIGKCSTEYSKIRYISAVIKNGVMDFKEKKTEEPPKVEVDMTMYETSYSTGKNKRRSLAELEDEVD